MQVGEIPEGTIDDRSIEDVKPEELEPFDQCHFFAGIGVWAYALKQAGWGDRPVWTGSCPCQPFSAAGKSGGFDDERHLWPAFHHLIRVRRPGVVFGEQVASKHGLTWLDLVQADLEGESYTVGAVDTCAAGFGAPHIRQRLYWVAHCEGERRGEEGAGSRRSEERAGNSGEPSTMAHTKYDGHGRPGRDASKQGGNRQEDRIFDGGNSGLCKATNGFWSDAKWLPCKDGKARPIEPGTFPLAHGIANRVGLLRGYGNAIVAPQAQTFIESYMEIM